MSQRPAPAAWRSSSPPPPSCSSLHLNLWAFIIFSSLEAGLFQEVVCVAADIICSKRKFIQNGECNACRPSKGSSGQYDEQEIGSSQTCLEPYRTLYGNRRLHCRWCQSKYTELFLLATKLSHFTKSLFY